MTYMCFSLSSSFSLCFAYVRMCLISELSSSLSLSFSRLSCEDLIALEIAWNQSAHAYLFALAFGTCVTCTVLYVDSVNTRPSRYDTSAVAHIQDTPRYQNWIQYTARTHTHTINIYEYMAPLNHLMATHYLENVCVCPHTHTRTIAHAYAWKMAFNLQINHNVCNWI